MPRLANSANSSYYHYLVRKYDKDDQLVEQRYMKTQKEITNTYGLNRSAIYYIINPVEGRVPRKNTGYEIEKVLVPVYQQIARYQDGMLLPGPPESEQQISVSTAG